MPTYSQSLRVELITPGTEANTWGTITNNNFAYVFDRAIAGYETVSVTSAGQALTTFNGPTATGSANQAVYAILRFTTTTVTTAFTVYAPPVSKQYIIWNDTAYTATVFNWLSLGPPITTPPGAQSVTIAPGDRVMIFTDGTSFYSVKAGNVTGTVAIANGGTGQTTQQAAINALVGTQTANRVLRSDGTNSTLAQVALATDVSGTLAIANGGTGQTTQQAAINALVGAQTANRVLRSDGTNSTLAQVALATDVSGTLAISNGGTGQSTAQGAMNTFAGAVTSGQFLRGNGTNVVMSAIQAADVPTLNQNTTGTAANVTGVVAVPNGGTGLTTPLTENLVLYTGTTSSFALSGNLEFNGTTLTVSGVRVGRGAGSVSTNTAVGFLALNTNTTGNNNTAVGNSALRLNTSGASNTAVGFSALNDNLTGVANTAVGNTALNRNTASNNTAVGSGALNLNTTGTSNTAIGSSALKSNDSGNNNTATGRDALEDNTTGASNTATGSDAMNRNVSGSSNTAFGYSSLRDNLTSNFNTAVGARALELNTAAQNTAVGYTALSANTSGILNVAVGSTALSSNATGGSNTAIGVSALSQNIDGENNVAVGNSALGLAASSSNNTAIGHGSMPFGISGGYNIGIGRSAFRDLSSGSGNTMIGAMTSAGTYSPTFNPTTESDRFCMGSSAVTDAYVKVNWTITSDARDKINFAPIPHGLAFVNQLKPTQFQFAVSRTDPTPHGPIRYGFKAQDILALEGSNPVIIDAEDPEMLRYRGESLVPVLVNAIKELSARIEALEAK
jgi:hypothetical protein